MVINYRNITSIQDDAPDFMNGDNDKAFISVEDINMKALISIARHSCIDFGEWSLSPHFM
jgi:hypothetical protein